LFVDFLLSHEGQKILGAAGYFAPRSDVISPILSEAPPRTKIVPLPMTLAARYNDYFQMYRKIMGLP
jgi:ABC-type Fe3+ transport system substrate-binding protein